MAIGILSAIDSVQGKTRADDNSVVPPIDRMAKLPQAYIMQLAQRGQIPKDMVAPILAKKAENAQAVAIQNAAFKQAAMQGGAVPPSTVIEKIITQNAAQENAPAMNKMNVGVASAPINSNMYSRGMAGGGIVAFQEGGLKRKFRSSPLEIEAALRGNLLTEDTEEEIRRALGNKTNIRDVTKTISPSGELNFEFQSDQGAYIPVGGISTPSTYQDAVAKRDAANLGVSSILNQKLDTLRKRFTGETPIQETTIQDPSQEVNFSETYNLADEFEDEDAVREYMSIYDASLTEEGRKKLEAVIRQKEGENKTVASDETKVDETKVDETVVDETKVDETTDKTVVDETIVDETKVDETIVDDPKNIVNEIKKDEKDNKEPKDFVGLSGDDLALIGVQAGLELIGTDKQNFFTALGTAGKPAIKTALAIQQEKKKQAFTKSERLEAQKFQSELEDKKQAGAKERQQIMANAPTKIMKTARFLALSRNRKKPNYADLFDASRVHGSNAATESAIIAVVGKGVEAGMDAFNNAVRAGGVLRDFQLLAVGRTAKLDPKEKQSLFDAKSELAQIRNISPDSISDKAAAQFILDQEQRKYINKSTSAAGVPPSKFKSIVEDKFPTGKRVNLLDLPR